MLGEIKGFLEEKRESHNLLWRPIIFAKDLARIIDLIFFKTSNKKIRNLNFAVTYSCNSRCSTCNIWKKYLKTPVDEKNELDLEEIKEIFLNSEFLKPLDSICLTGGDPFLRYDFTELCGFFIQKYPNVNISIPTNALNPELVYDKLKIIDEKYGSEKISLSVSIDGVGYKNDAIRGIPGNYENALKLIHELHKIPRIKVNIGFTIIPENIGEIIKGYELSKKMGVEFSCFMGQVSENYYANTEKENTEFKWDEKKLNELDDIIKSLIILREKNGKSKGGDFTGIFLSKMVEFQKNQSRLVRCFSGIDSLFMDPYGVVYPCILLDHKIGDAKHGFDKIWSSPKAKDVRTYVRRKKCACWTPCETLHSLSKNFRTFIIDQNHRLWRLNSSAR